MISQLPDFDRLLLILFAVLLLKLSWRLYSPRLRRRWKNAKARLPRRWKPRSPKDCPHCCQGLSLESRPVQREVEPYAKRKCTRGRKKEICTAGFACLNPLCEYFGITDDQGHALVGNGRRGINNDIQHFRCQACKQDFTCRRNTPLMRKTWSLAQSPEHLLLHCEWWRTYYHFVRAHDSLQQPLPGLPRARILRTPAMAAGITDQLWSVGTILKMPLYPALPG